MQAGGRRHVFGKQREKGKVGRRSTRFCRTVLLVARQVENQIRRYQRLRRAAWRGVAWAETAVERNGGGVRLRVSPRDKLAWCEV